MDKTKEQLIIEAQLIVEAIRKVNVTEQPKDEISVAVREKIHEYIRNEGYTRKISASDY